MILNVRCLIFVTFLIIGLCDLSYSRRLPSMLVNDVPESDIKINSQPDDTYQDSEIFNYRNNRIEPLSYQRKLLEQQKDVLNTLETEVNNIRRSIAIRENSLDLSTKANGEFDTKVLRNQNDREKKGEKYLMLCPFKVCNLGIDPGVRYRRDFHEPLLKPIRNYFRFTSNPNIKTDTN